jgi:hypothetical protein
MNLTQFNLLAGHRIDTQLSSSEIKPQRASDDVSHAAPLRVKLGGAASFVEAPSESLLRGVSLASLQNSLDRLTDRSLQ